MLKSIVDFFERQVATPAAEPAPHRLEVACAALLIEVVRSNEGIDAAERATILAAIGEKFHLDAREAQRLAELAEEEVRTASGYFQFTTLINRHFSAAQKLRLVELMWQAAYADGTLSAHEQHVLRKMADLLHVPHGDYIAAKLRAREGSG